MIIYFLDALFHFGLAKLCQTQKLVVDFKLNYITKNKKRSQAHTQNNEFFLSHITQILATGASFCLVSFLQSLFSLMICRNNSNKISSHCKQKNENNERIAYFKCFLFQFQYEIVNLLTFNWKC